MKWVLVESTPSSVESFSETKPATFWRLGAVDEDQQVVGPRHQVAGLDLVELADPLGQPVEAAAPLRGHLDLDHGADRRGALAGKVEHRPPAEKDPVLLQLLKVPLDLGFGECPRPAPFAPS